MARTRSESTALIILNTGRSDKSTLISSLHDSALKVAITHHPFNDACHICDDLAITEDATSVSIASLTEATVTLGSIVDIITARIVEADGSRNALLKMKGRQWWDRNVINSEDNMKGWPEYGLKFGSNVMLDRPADSGLELRLRVSTVPTYSSDSAECPIEILDIFVEQYVTAMTFMSLEMMDKYWQWKNMALGRNYDQGVVGGTLLNCILNDEKQIAEERTFGDSKQLSNGLTIYDTDTGRTNTWY